MWLIVGRREECWWDPRLLPSPHRRGSYHPGDVGGWEPALRWAACRSPAVAIPHLQSQANAAACVNLLHQPPSRGTSESPFIAILCQRACPSQCCHWPPPYIPAQGGESRCGHSCTPPPSSVPALGSGASAALLSPSHLLPQPAWPPTALEGTVTFPGRSRRPRVSPSSFRSAPGPLPGGGALAWGVGARARSSGSDPSLGPPSLPPWERRPSPRLHHGWEAARPGRHKYIFMALCVVGQ